MLVEEPVYDELVSRLKEATEKLVVGDPTDRNVYLGPVINKAWGKRLTALAAQSIFQQERCHGRGASTAGLVIPLP